MYKLFLDGPLAVLVAVTGLLCGGCDVGDASASAQPARLVLMDVTQPIAQAAQALPSAPTTPTPAAVVGVGVAADQPEGQTPTIIFLGPRPPQFPFKMDFSSPPEPPSFIELSPIKLGEAAQTRLRRLMQAEMARYPSGTLGSVSQIFVGSTLTHSGRSVGGVHFMGLVFIGAGEQDSGTATDAHVVRALHHEVSHALMEKHGTYGTKFDAARFRAALPPGFVYTDDRPGADKEAPFRPGDDTVSLELLDEGFLAPWAQCNMEEDFASYAEDMLNRPGSLLDLFAADSAVGRKARVVRDFYLAIDPRFAAMFATGGLTPRDRVQAAIPAVVTPVGLAPSGVVTPSAPFAPPPPPPPPGE